MMIYPIMLIEDRYNGAYSGGKWLAAANANGGVFKPNWDIDREYKHRADFLVEGPPSGGDSDAIEFWDHIYPKHKYATLQWLAVGDRPDEAIENLKEQNEQIR